MIPTVTIESVVVRLTNGDPRVTNLAFVARERPELVSSGDDGVWIVHDQKRLDLYQEQVGRKRSVHLTICTTGGTIAISDYQLLPKESQVYHEDRHWYRDNRTSSVRLQGEVESLYYADGTLIHYSNYSTGDRAITAIDVGTIDDTGYQYMFEMAFMADWVRSVNKLSYHKSELYEYNHNLVSDKLLRITVIDQTPASE